MGGLLNWDTPARAPPPELLLVYFVSLFHYISHEFVFTFMIRVVIENRHARREGRGQPFSVSIDRLSFIFKPHRRDAFMPHAMSRHFMRHTFYLDVAAIEMMMSNA